MWEQVGIPEYIKRLQSSQLPKFCFTVPQKSSISPLFGEGCQSLFQKIPLPPDPRMDHAGPSISKSVYRVFTKIWKHHFTLRCDILV